MAKTDKKKFCGLCGADIRQGSAFCYKCGGAVGEKPQKVEVSSAWLKESLDQPESVEPMVEPQPAETKKLDVKTVKEALEAEEESEKTAVTESTPSDKKLETAASMRKRPKKTTLKATTYVWEPKDDSNGFGFVIVSLILVGICALFVFAAYYLH